MAAKTRIREKDKADLVWWYQFGGYMRVPNKERKKTDGPAYRKGYEIRFIAYTKPELTELRQLITHAGFKAAKPFKKANQWVQPVYGQETHEIFTDWLHQYSDYYE